MHPALPAGSGAPPSYTVRVFKSPVTEPTSAEISANGKYAVVNFAAGSVLYNLVTGKRLVTVPYSPADDLVGGLTNTGELFGDGTRTVNSTTTTEGFRIRDGVTTWLQASSAITRAYGCADPQGQR